VALDRQAVIGIVVGIAVAGAAYFYFFAASDAPPPAAQQTATSEPTVDPEELMKPGALEDMVLGNADAKVTIVEYMSLTCPHCASFHKNTYPALKEKYLDTGKVKFVLREFPLDQVAWVASMLTRCLDKSKFFPVTEVLLDKQRVWAASQDPATELFNIFKQAGMTRDEFDACQKNQELAQNVIAVKERGEKEFNVGSTPTFFVNGHLVTGNQSVEEFDKLIEPLL
jgi:protein-disulfide isomerase